MGDTRIPVAALALAAALLAGCAGAGSVPDPADPADREPGSGGGEASGGDTPCLLGDWSLDVADYEAQSRDYLTGLGIPLEAFALSGSHVVSFRSDVVTIGVDLTADAVVMGVAISAPQQYAGQGEWFWEADDATSIAVEGWAYTVEPAATDPSAPAAPPMFDPAGSAPISAECSGDRLALRGDGAPLVGNFTRSG